MGKLRIMTGNAIKRSNRDAIKQYNERLKKNTSRHFAKLHGGFDSLRAVDPYLKGNLNYLRGMNKYITELKHKLPKSTINEFKENKMTTQDGINLVIQNTALANIERAFGSDGFLNSNITSDQISKIHDRKNELYEKLSNGLIRKGTRELDYKKCNLAIKEMTSNMTRIINIYLGDEIYKRDGRTKQILVNQILDSFQAIENKYLKEKS